MVEVSGLPGICRSNTGVADTDEPCTKSIVPVSLSEDPPAPRFLSCLRHRKSLMLSLPARSEEHTSELQSPCNLVCRLLLEKKKESQSHVSGATCPAQYRS